MHSNNRRIKDIIDSFKNLPDPLKISFDPLKILLIPTKNLLIIILLIPSKIHADPSKNPLFPQKPSWSLQTLQNTPRNPQPSWGFSEPHGPFWNLKPPPSPSWFKFWTSRYKVSMHLSFYSYYFIVYIINKSDTKIKINVQKVWYMHNWVK